jgi:putative transposase
LIKQFAKAILERALQAEMTTHLGHEPGESVSNEAGNKRNGATSKTVQGELGFLAPTAARRCLLGIKTGTGVGSRMWG